MPYKTKKHKEAAAGRRIVFAQNVLATYKGIGRKENKLSEVKIENIEKTDSLKGDYLNVLKDLSKIGLLSALIISAQIILKVFVGKMPVFLWP